jgi:hypothetical protein
MPRATEGVGLQKSGHKAAVNLNGPYGAEKSVPRSSLFSRNEIAFSP